MYCLVNTVAQFAVNLVHIQDSGYVYFVTIETKVAHPTCRPQFCGLFQVFQVNGHLSFIGYRTTLNS